MGRQIAANLAEEDEIEFLRFLRRSADIQLIRSFARTKDSLFVDAFEPRGPWNWTYYVWNRAFPWVPTFAQTRADLPDVERRGWYYIDNTSAAPLLEYSRKSPGPNGMDGRLYWAKTFSAPHGLAYDVPAFERWYEAVTKWLRQRAKAIGAL